MSMRPVGTIRARRTLSTGLAAAVLLAFSVACPSKSGGAAEPKSSNTASSAAGSAYGSDGGAGAEAHDVAAGNADDKTATPSEPGYRGLLAKDGVACAKPGCMYHDGAKAYHQCLSAGAGTCFHYGPTCAPAPQTATQPGTRCMFDPDKGQYQSCSRVVEGRCVSSSGASCEPIAKCYYNPVDRLHHVCKRAASGRCREFGAVCDPGALASTR